MGKVIGETKTPIPMKPGSEEKYDYEYVRNGVCNIFMSNEPLSGKRYVKVTERKTKRDWACFIDEISSQYQDAEKIILVMFYKYLFGYERERKVLYNKLQGRPCRADFLDDVVYVLLIHD